VGSLDERFGWSAMPLAMWPVGGALYAGFLAVTTLAMIENTHFEKTARIQADREHKVIETGPYAVVRHPGYVGTILGFILTPPLLLGSWWAFLPAGGAALTLIARTALEDRMLRRELSGYEEYTRKVRFRLLPGIW